MDSPNPTSAPQPPLEAMASSFMPARVVLSAAELGILEYLRKGKASATRIAADLELDRGALEVLLDALASIGVLEKCRARYWVREELSSSCHGERETGSGSTLGHLASHWESWSTLTDVVRGRPPARRTWTRERIVDLAAAMRSQASRLAPRIAALVDCTDVHRALDVGCGPAAYAVELAQRYPATRWVCLDRHPDMLDIASEEVRSRGLEQRITTQPGDFLRGDLGRDFDLVLLSSVICLCPGDDVLRLLRNSARALRPGGRLVIHDSLVDDSRTSPRSAALFSVTMLVGTGGGRAHSIRELSGWLRDLGFARVHWLPLNPTSIVFATRTGEQEREIDREASLSTTNQRNAQVEEQ